jgi:hypothetical protein
VDEIHEGSKAVEKNLENTLVLLYFRRASAVRAADAPKVLSVAP